MAKNNNALSFADLHDLLMKPMETMISEGKQCALAASITGCWDSSIC